MTAAVAGRTSAEVANAYRDCERIARDHYENFAIGALVLPRRLRRHVAALYAFIRTADDLADEGSVPVATRLERLDAWHAALEGAYAGRANHPIFIALADTVGTFDIPIEPFQRLLAAFRSDAAWHPFATDDDLLTYCRSAADPVGHLVLALCGYRDAERRILSNKVCTGLQLTNFWQDLGVDVARGRVYLPIDTLRRHGCDPAAVARGEDTRALRRCLLAEVARARRLLREGEALGGLVERSLRLEVRVFVASGLAILDKITAADGSVMLRRPALSSREQAQILLRVALPLGAALRRLRDRRRRTHVPLDVRPGSGDVARRRAGPLGVASHGLVPGVRSASTEKSPSAPGRTTPQRAPSTGAPDRSGLAVSGLEPSACARDRGQGHAPAFGAARSHTAAAIAAPTASDATAATRAPSQKTQWEAFVAALRSCGVVVKEDRVSRSLFVTDAGGLAFGISQGVVTPRSAEEVAAVLQAAQQHRVPVTTRGGGLTTDGESVATGGCLLDLSAINRVLHVDADGLTARVEAGIHWHTLAEHLRRKGLDYISAPLNFTSSVGGTLAVGGLDINSFRHGCSADQAVALRVVTPTGTIVECSGREQSALFEQVLFGYGQFGVIVEATLRIRPYTPISMLYWVYPSLRRALEDYIAVVEADAADYAGVITINDTANALFVAFDSDVREHTFTSTWTPRLRGMTAGRFAASMLLHFGMRPWRWSEASFMALRARGILLGLHRPEHRQDGKLVDRASLLSRLVWTQWGSRQVVNPNLCTTATKLISVVEHGAAVCKRWLPFYTLYIIAARRHPGRTRYELSALPPDAGELAFGCSFEPTMRPGDHSPEHLQRFKDDLFAVGLEYQCSYYRFGGRMKAFIRRALGDAVVDKHLAIKRRMDPGMILNPHVIF